MSKHQQTCQGYTTTGNECKRRTGGVSLFCVYHKTQENDIIFISSDEDDSALDCCGICFEACKSKRVLRCKHTFCRPCLKKWLDMGKTTCPMCRARVPT